MAALFGALTFPAAAWDYESHRVVNELALATLPTNFPPIALTQETRTRLAYQADEGDRWRNETSIKNGTGLALSHASGPDHFIDLEDLKLIGLTPATLPALRYDFVASLVKARAAHPEKFPAIDPKKDADHTWELCGFLPWAITEYYEKLQSAFATLAALEKFGGTPTEIANAKQNLIYVMGVMGHFVGDASQPLHTTIHHHGWVGENPKHYTTSFGFHAWIDGGFFKNTGGLEAKALAVKTHPAGKIPAAEDPNGIFYASVQFILAANQLVEPLYLLDRDGKLSLTSGRNDVGRAFLEAQLVKSGQLLGDLWFTAWATAPEDTFLEHELQRRATNEIR